MLTAPRMYRMTRKLADAIDARARELSREHGIVVTPSAVVRAILTTALLTRQGEQHQKKKKTARRAA